VTTCAVALRVAGIAIRITTITNPHRLIDLYIRDDNSLFADNAEIKTDMNTAGIELLLPTLHALVETPLHTMDRSCLPILRQDEWQVFERMYKKRIDDWLDPHLARRSRHESNPVVDFLFEYYRFRPSLLKRWSPGTGVILEGAEADKFLETEGFSRSPTGVFLDTNAFPAHLHNSTRWIRDMLVSTRDRAPHFGCSGMHEWAMIYGYDPVRHEKTPLRLDRRAINTIVEESVLSCTHFDAFRFFTPDASKMNTNRIDRTTMADNEQPACLHANMDLYRWAMKRTPWISSGLIADTFFLAVEIRDVDMRASPYDLSAWGIAPIPVETPEGKREYLTCQKNFLARANPLRQQLIDEYDALLTAVNRAR